MYLLLSWRVWCCNKCDQTHHYKTHWRIADCFGMLCQQQTNWNTKQNILKYANVMWRVVSLKPMPWSHFTKGAFPGSSRAVFGIPIGSRLFFTPRGPQVTINSNLKVTWAPAINKPRIKPVNYPVGARRGPCRHPPGTQGQFLTKSTQDTRPAPRYSVGRLWCPDLACRWPGRCSDGAFTMSERAPVGNLVGTIV